jgi:hypothetical protein
VAGGINSIKSPNNTMKNGTHDLWACVPDDSCLLGYEAV